MTPPPRVLVVEDEDNIASALEFVITREGFAHDRVASGAEALPRIAATHPNLVLLDIMLPEVSGYEICHRIRTDPALSQVKVLMMTARGSALERKRGLDLGADGFIAKPFELKDLRAEVHRLLGTQGASSFDFVSSSARPAGSDEVTDALPRRTDRPGR